MQWFDLGAAEPFVLLGLLAFVAAISCVAASRALSVLRIGTVEKAITILDQQQTDLYQRFQRYQNRENMAKARAAKDKLDSEVEDALVDEHVREPEPPANARAALYRGAIERGLLGR